MILQSLHALYDRLLSDQECGVARIGYSQQNVGFEVVLRRDGSLHDINDLRKGHGSKKQLCQLIVPGGDKRTGKITPKSAPQKAGFLRNDSAFMLGVRIDKAGAKRSRIEFEAFRRAHLEVEKDVDSEEFSIVCRFLDKWNPDSLDERHRKIVLGAQGVFKIIGERHYVHDCAAVTDYWRKRTDDSKSATKVRTGWCLVTGREGPLASTHEPTFSVFGGQKAGARIVSFNLDALSSYGKQPSTDKSLNAPVSKGAVFRYCTALNALLSDPKKEKHRLLIGGTTVVFWTEQPTAFEHWFSDLLVGDLPESSQDMGALKRIQELLRALRAGGTADIGRLGDDPSTRFFILGLAPNAARLSVRFWHVSTLRELFERLHSHYEALRIVRQFGEGSKRPDREFPPIWMLLRETAREMKDIQPLLAGALMRAIMTGGPYPNALALAVLGRIRADREINYYRAAILKAWLTRQISQPQGVLPVSLDPDKPEPAYRLGRLFAVLEKTQQDALGNINATIRDRFYSAASATPGMVFPRLLRTYQHHLAKLNPGAKINRERLVQDIVDGLSTMPTHLALEGQGLFAIGYYHQRKDLFTRRAAEAESDSGNATDLP